MRLSVLILFILLYSPVAGAQPPATPLKAPAALYPEPAVYLLLRLPGDNVTVRYTPGSLDRAANLQHRLELATRAFKRWSDTKLDLNVYVINHEEWRQARYDVAYGVPVRVGRRSVAAPAEGDEDSVRLWADLLQGSLPAVAGRPLRGTPQQAATMGLADMLVQLQAAEILIDEIGIAGDQPWVRGLMTHLASIDLVRRYEEVRLKDLDAMYKLLSRRAGPRAFSVRDYGPDVGLRDWMWFQAQFHFGAQRVLAKTGKGALKKMKKLRRKSDGVLTGERLLRRFKELNEWHQSSFAAVSMRR